METFFQKSIFEIITSQCMAFIKKLMRSLRIACIIYTYHTAFIDQIFESRTDL